MRHAELHLASSSARRREILTALGVSFTWAGVDLDETPLAAERAAGIVQRLATAKAQAARSGCERPVLGADTAVAVGKRIFGKPESKQDALAMLAALSGRTHQVVTAVALSCDRGTMTAMSTTDVSFREITADEALAYWQSGEPAGKAGAYAVQGIGGMFVRELSGSYSGVVGLPVFETAALLNQAGIDLLRRA